MCPTFGQVIKIPLFLFVISFIIHAGIPKIYDFRMYTVFLQEQAVGERLFLNTMIQYATIIIVIVDEINWTIC